MIKSNAQESGKAGDATRQRIVDAALETLKHEGFAGATSRAIARRGGFNQALIFYHFGSLDSLLLAALDRTSSERLKQYRAAVEQAETLEELVELLVRARGQDRETGHTAVVVQMIAGSVARPELAPQIVARMEEWVDLAQQALAKVVARLPFPVELPLRDLAYAACTFELGANLLTHLDEGRRIDALLGQLERLLRDLAS